MGVNKEEYKETLLAFGFREPMDFELPTYLTPITNDRSKILIKGNLCCYIMDKYLDFKLYTGLGQSAGARLEFFKHWYIESLGHLELKLNELK